MVTPADVRQHLGLKTGAHDDLIELAIMAVDLEASLWGVAMSPAQILARVGRVVSDYPEITRALRKEAANV